MILPYDPTQDATRVEARARNRGLAHEPADTAEDAVPPGTEPASSAGVLADGPAGDPGAAWAPFDPGDPPPHPPLRHGRGAVVAVVASTELVGVGWAVSVTVELARAWAGERAGVVLVDTNFDRPRVHHGVGVINATGLAEVLSGTASITEATHVLVEDRLFCVPAGNAPERTGKVFAPGRWSKLCRAFTDAGVTLVAYVPLEAPWRDAVLETATDLVELREQHAALPWDRPGHLPLLAVLGPMPLVRPPTDPTGRQRSGKTPLLGFPPVGEPEGEDAEASVVWPGAPDGPPSPEAPEDADAVPEPVDAASGEAPVSPASPETEQPPQGGAPIDLLPLETRASVEAQRRRRRMQVAWVLAVGAAAFFFALRLSTGPGTAAPAPGEDGTAGGLATGTVTGSEAATGPGAPPPTSSSGAGTEAASPDVVSVQVGAFADRGGAEQLVTRFESVVPGVPWSIVPVEVGGTVYHRVMAGLVADSAQAEALADRLAAAGALAAPDAIVRVTTLVYDLGARATLEAARETAVSLGGEGIHAAPYLVTRDDGSTVVHVYAGGFSDPSEAAHLGDRLTALGLPAELRPRMGRPAS